MQRRKKLLGVVPGYPDIPRYLKLYGHKAGVGLVLGFTAAGCIWPWARTTGDIAPVDTQDSAVDDTGRLMGDIADTSEVYYALLPAHGSRNLTFEDPWGWIDYQVQLVVDDLALYEWLAANPVAALEAVDAVLGRHEIFEFDAWDGDPVIEAEIAQALSDAFTGSTGADPSAIVELTLAILAYTDENDIDGEAG